MELKPNPSYHSSPEGTLTKEGSNTIRSVRINDHETSYLSPGVHLNGGGGSAGAGGGRDRHTPSPCSSSAPASPGPPRSPIIRVSPSNSLNYHGQRQGLGQNDSLYSNNMYNHGSNGNLYEDMSQAAPSVFNPRYHSWQYDKYDSVVNDRESHRISNNALCVVVGVLFTISILISVGALGIGIWVSIHQMALINNATETVDTLTTQFTSLQATVSEISQDIQNFFPEEGGIELPQCGPGLWMRTALINMTDPAQLCPDTWMLYTQGTDRTCGRPDDNPNGCHPVRFPADGEYNRVCGRARGFGYETPDAFQRFTLQPNGNPDDNYVDGLSITHGSFPRQHIWTFAGTTYGNCPCAVFPPNETIGAPPPDYVGSHYFCESGLHGNVPTQPETIYTNNTLWDGQGCLTSHCCEFQSPPWFSVEVEPSSDDLEVRLCGDQLRTDEDIVIQLVELYVQFQ